VPETQQKLAAQVQTKKHSPDSSGLEPQTSFSDHIAELRRRIFFVLLAFMAASSLAYTYRDNLLGVIMQPLHGEKLIYLTPGGGFNFIFQISLYAGILAAAPVLIHQLYGFIRPALPKKAQRSSGVVVLVAFLLMLSGIAFGYFIAVPSALTFLNTFAGSEVTPNLTADSYLSFFLAYIAGLGVLFELPLLLLFLHWIHPMTPGKLLKTERFVILFAFVAAALITPTPDMLNQTMIAVPLILIYQLGVIAVLLVIRRDRKRARKLEKVVQARKVTEAKPIPQQIIQQMPTPSAALKPQATQPTKVSRPQPRASIDGFSVRSRAPLQPPKRSSIPPPQRAAPQPARRPAYSRPLSVDGFSYGKSS
jgi:sec-independent protein translocase protein TatC